MLPSSTDLMAGGGRRAQGCHLSPLLRSPAPEGEQSLHVLTRGDQQSFDVHLLEPPESELPHSVPILSLGEQRLDPHLAFA